MSTLVKYALLTILFITLPLSLFAAQQLYFHYRGGKPNSTALKDGKLHIFFCGTGDPQANMQVIRKPSCLAIIVDNSFFLIDSGEGSIQTLAAMGLPIGSIDKVFFTHYHSDHIAGLGQIVNASWMWGRKVRFVAYGPKGIKRITQSINDLYQHDVQYRVANRAGALNANLGKVYPKEIPTRNTPQLVYQTKNIRLYAFRVDHNPAIPALGYVLYYKGCKIVISGDTKITGTLAEQAKNATVLINEAFSRYFYDQTIKAIKKDNPKNAKQLILHENETKQYHSDTLLLAKMAQADHVKYVFLTHLVPAIPNTQEAKDEFMDGMKQFYNGNLQIADDRDELVISSANSSKQCLVKYVPNKNDGYKIYKNSHRSLRCVENC